jgi:CubicO group peptidase (beta-lactamase class C family)
MMIRWIFCHRSRSGILCIAVLLPAMSYSLLQPTTPPENLNSLLQPILKKHDLPALAGAIVTSQGLSAVGAVGVRKYGTNTLVTIDDQFHLGSETKAMTATMLATLVEEGKLSWDTTLEQAFPELLPKMNPAYRKVTLEQLLAHRAGFTVESWPKGMNFAEVHTIPGTPRQQRATYVAMILKEPPDYTPAASSCTRTAAMPWQERSPKELPTIPGSISCSSAFSIR